MTDSLSVADHITVIVVGNGRGDPNSNLDEAICISLSANAPRKGMNPTILPLVMGK